MKIQNSLSQIERDKIRKETLESNNKYLAEKLSTVIEPMVINVLNNRPE